MKSRTLAFEMLKLTRSTFSGKRSVRNLHLGGRNRYAFVPLFFKKNTEK